MMRMTTSQTTSKSKVSSIMPGRIIGLALVSFLLACTFPSGASAHQQKTAVTRILFNPNTGNIEVMHRFFVHDAEHAASLIFGERQALMESAESRQLFSTYVINGFAVEAHYEDGSSEELELSLLGSEIDGQFLWVYQEIPQTKKVVAMTIVNLALRDVWSDQSNLVNVERAGSVYSLTFDGSDEVLTIDMPG